MRHIPVQSLLTERVTKPLCKRDICIDIWFFIMHPNIYLVLLLKWRALAGLAYFETLLQHFTCAELPPHWTKELHPHKLTCLGRVLLFHTHRHGTYAWSKKDPTMGESLGTSHLLWLNHTLLLLKYWKRLSCLERDISPWTLLHLWGVSITTCGAQKPIHTLYVYRERINPLTFTIYIELNICLGYCWFFSPRKHDGFLLPSFFKGISPKPLLQLRYTCTIFSFEYSLFCFDSVNEYKNYWQAILQSFTHIFIYLAKTVSLGEHLW